MRCISAVVIEDTEDTGEEEEEEEKEKKDFREVRCDGAHLCRGPLSRRGLNPIKLDGRPHNVCEALICKKALSVKNYRALISKSP